MDKNEFRTFARNKLANVTQKYQKNKLILERLDRLIKQIQKKHKIKNILSYMPLEAEPDVRRFNNECKKKFRCFIPFIQKVTFKMVRYRYPFSKSTFHTWQSSPSAFYKQDLDVALVPVIGVDVDRRRIGFGKGMYDRFFHKKKYKKIIIIFIQLEQILSYQKITESFDIRCDYYVTATKNTRLSRHIG